MRFSNPLGFLCLLAIPALIIIYVIKSHYTEQVVSSVYLWKLSEKFLKRRRKLSGVSGILSLILQIIAVLAITLTVAGPVFTTRGSAGVYCFVLDGSASMNTQKSGVTRFERGKNKIENIITSSKNGSVYTLILIDGDTSVVFERETDKQNALKQLSSLNAGWGSSSPADAIFLAQQYYDEDDATATYLITDKTYDDATNINLINVADHEENYYLTSYKLKTAGSDITVSGGVMSTENDALLTLELHINGEKVASTHVLALQGEETEYSLTTPYSGMYSSAKVVITNKDGLMQDNEGVIYNIAKGDDNRVLIVSDAPVYLKSAFTALGGVSVTTVTPHAYETAPNDYIGYGLYVFDTFAASTLAEIPKTAPVWIFNPNSSIQKTGFGYQSQMSYADNSPDYFEPEYTRATSSFVTKLTKGLAKQQIAVKKYAKCVLNRNFTTILSNGDDSLLFVGTNEYGNREVVFAFDLHDSNLALKADFIPLVSNLLTYTFPPILETSSFVAGEAAEINVISGCSNIVLKSPSGVKSYPQLTNSVTEAPLLEAGSYTLTATVNGVDRMYRLYARVPSEESHSLAGGALALTGNGNGKKTNGYYDGLVAYFVLLALVFFADWGVYCYEQFQLR